MKKITWCSPHPNHYHSYLLTNLSIMPDIEVEAVYFYKKMAKYPWKTEFVSKVRETYLNKALIVDWGFILKALGSRKQLFIIAGWNDPTMFILITLFSLFGRKFILYSDTPSLKKRTGINQKIRQAWLKWIYKKLWYFFVTGAPGLKALAALGVNTEKIINFPFATNNLFFVPKEGKKAIVEELIFISSGRLDNGHKGYDIAIKCFYQFKKDNPKKFKYLIAGDGPDRNKIEELINALELNEEVKLLGWLEPDELLSFYHEGDIFLHPSYFDPFPNAVLEAMSCGLPVIGSDTAGSVLDRVKEGENGFIHKSGNTESLTEKLKLVFKLTEKEIIRLGQNARKTALDWPVEYNKSVIKKVFMNFKEENQKKYL